MEFSRSHGQSENAHPDMQAPEGVVSSKACMASAALLPSTVTMLSCMELRPWDATTVLLAPVPTCAHHTANTPQASASDLSLHNITNAEHSMHEWQGSRHVAYDTEEHKEAECSVLRIAQ